MRDMLLLVLCILRQYPRHRVQYLDVTCFNTRSLHIPNVAHVSAGLAKSFHYLEEDVRSAGLGQGLKYWGPSSPRR